MGILCSNLVSELLGEVAPPAGPTLIPGWHGSVWDLMADMVLIGRQASAHSLTEAETASSSVDTG